MTGQKAVDLGGHGLPDHWLASAYAVFGVAHPGTLPAPELAGLLAEWSFIPVFTGIGFMGGRFAPAIKVGRRLVWDARDVAAWLESQREAPKVA